MSDPLTNRPVAPDDVGQLARFVMSDSIGAEFLRTIERVTTTLGAAMPHALIGGQAVFFRGYRRFSKDVDFGVIGSARDAVRALVHAGFELRQAARLRDPDTNVEVDVVRLPRAVLDRVRTAEILDLGGGVRAPVIDLESLVALKVKVGRLQDQADVVELLKSGAEPDRATVATLLGRLGEPAGAYDDLVEEARREASTPPPSLDDHGD